MALSVEDVFHLECVARTEAKILRIRNPISDLTNPDVSDVIRDFVRRERRRADDFDQIGNILSGLQADWAGLAPLVREGFMRLQREYDAQTQRIKAIAAEADPG